MGELNLTNYDETFHNLSSKEVLDQAKGIIEAIPSLMQNNKLNWPPVEYCQSMTHVMSHLLHHIKDVRNPEALVLILPAQLR